MQRGVPFEGMTQLYVGNLSADGDEKAIRQLFSRYGAVREVLMKNGYAFVEFEEACSADTAMRDLNGECCIAGGIILDIKVVSTFKVQLQLKSQLHTA